jgi:PleD family two-component response regulator
MRDEPHRPVVRTRDDLLRLIADAICLQLTHLTKKQAIAVADTILRSFKMAGLSISRRRKDR